MDMVDLDNNEDNNEDNNNKHSDNKDNNTRTMQQCHCYTV